MKIEKYPYYVVVNSHSGRKINNGGPFYRYYGACDFRNKYLSEPREYGAHIVRVYKLRGCIREHSY